MFALIVFRDEGICWLVRIIIINQYAACVQTQSDISDSYQTLQ